MLLYFSVCYLLRLVQVLILIANYWQVFILCLCRVILCHLA